MIRPVITIPDERLLRVCSPIPGVDEFRDIADDLFDTADSLKELDGKPTSCAGLAAPQIGILKRVFVLTTCGYRLCFVNPEITKRRGKVELSEEKCFSEPGIARRVPRFPMVTIKSRTTPAINLRGFAAFVAQHEMDHLDGILISDKGIPA